MKSIDLQFIITKNSFTAFRDREFKLYLMLPKYTFVFKLRRRLENSFVRVNKAVFMTGRKGARR